MQHMLFVITIITIRYQVFEKTEDPEHLPINKRISFKVLLYYYITILVYWPNLMYYIAISDQQATIMFTVAAAICEINYRMYSTFRKHEHFQEKSINSFI